MPKPFKPQIISANDLMDGDVVYLTDAHDWTRDLRCAAIARSAEEASALLEAASQPAEIVGAYLLDVAETQHGPVPQHFRERFRDHGPSNRPDLGRQAEQPHASGAY